MGPMNSSEMAASIRKHYSLEQTETGWKATSDYDGITAQGGRYWASCETIEYAERSRVTWEARCQWGHFNFEGEARAFFAIFTD